MIPVRAYFRLFSGYLEPHRTKAMLLAGVMLISIALQLVNPQLIKQFIDGATSGNPASDLISIAAAFMAIAVLHQVLVVWATFLAEQIGWSATNQLRADLTDHALHLDMGFHKSTSPGELIEHAAGTEAVLDVPRGQSRAWRGLGRRTTRRVPPHRNHAC